MLTKHTNYNGRHPVMSWVKLIFIRIPLPLPPRPWEKMRWPLRKRTILIFTCIVIATAVAGGLIGVSMCRDHEKAHQLEVAHLHLRLDYFQSLFRSQQGDAFAHENTNNSTSKQPGGVVVPQTPNSLALEVVEMLKNVSGTRTHDGFNSKNLAPLKVQSVSYQLLPHLLKNRNTLRPSFHMGGGRNFADLVIGLTSVKRDKESYLTITLMQLVEGLSPEDEPRTVIIVYLGETDPSFIISAAYEIERLFTKHLESGLLEVIAPSADFYPDLDQMRPTLGDSMKRFKWRTKQNLDNIFLMTFGQKRGTFYLMLEDDIMSKNNYFTEITKFIATTTVSSPDWVVLEFCRVGGIGKLFRNAELTSFITYVQIFYTNMPIDWLIESYLTHKICNIEKSDKHCATAKMEIRPRYHESLFQHIGLYSSLPGKIQKLKDNHFGKVVVFTPHKNPLLAKLNTTIKVYSDYTLGKAYNGEKYFWGFTPKEGDIIEFKFGSPIGIERYKFKSGSVTHVSDKLYWTDVEILPASNRLSSYIKIGQFNELGVAEGEVESKFGLLCSIRLHVRQTSKFWVILSEILIQERQI